MAKVYLKKKEWKKGYKYFIRGDFALFEIAVYSFFLRLVTFVEKVKKKVKKNKFQNL